MTVTFRVLDGPVVEVAFGGRRTTVRTLEQLRRVLDEYQGFDAKALERVGIVACFFAADQQSRSGGDLDWSSLQKVLDPYFFVLQEPTANAALHRGIESAIERIRELRSMKREEDLGKELTGMLR